MRLVKRATTDTDPQIVEGWTTGRLAQNVVGESRYTPQLKRITKRLGGGPTGEAMTTAIVTAEPQNQYDANAVKVTIDGDTVGYLPREDAVDYSPALLRLAAHDICVAVPARVWWGGWGDDDDWTASVRLDLGPPELLLPINAPPSGAAIQLPPGKAIQVTGEDQHLDVLTPLVAGTGHVAILATLHEVTEQKTRSARQVLEVRVDGRPIGRLTPAMSEHLLAAVRHADRSGVVVYTRASVKGNALKAEVTIYPTKAADLPQAWLDELASRTTTTAGTETQRVENQQPQPQPHAPAALPPAGWFPNPTGPGWRWWNGAAWTEHTHDR